MSRKTRAQKTKVKSRGKELPGFKTGYKKQKEGRQLEAALNQAMQRNDFDTACQIADVYIDKYQSELNYKHLVVVAEIYLQRDHFKKAHDLLMAALKKDPESELAPEILFWVHQKRGDGEGANQVLDQLVREGPEEKQWMYAHWEMLRGNSESDGERVLAAFERTELPTLDNPRYHELMFSYLMALIQASRLDEAERILNDIPDEVQNSTPNMPMLRAQLIKASGSNKGAISQYDQVVEQFNGLPEAVWNRALCRLEDADLDGGWEDYLRRFEWKQFPSPRVLIDAPEWQGESLSGKTIIIWAEQGLGDQILFLTTALPLIKDPTIDVVLAVHPKLTDLVSAWYPEARVEAVTAIDARNLKEFSGADYQVPMGSLPRYFMNTPEKLIGRPVRFLSSDHALRASIIREEGWDESSLIVGVCWRSNVIDVSRAPHYLSVAMVKTLVANLPSNVRLVSLQYRLTDEEREVLKDCDVHVPDIEFFDEILSHGRYVGVCDYVVTPATLTKQLAGLFNRPTLTWGGSNWSYLGQKEYPWYRSIATLKLSKDHSKSSLVYQVGRWLKIAIENHALIQSA